MTKKRKGKHLWLDLTVIALVLTAADVSGVKKISSVQAQDRGHESPASHSKNVQSVIVKVVGNSKRGVLYRKQFTLTKTNSKYALIYSCTGWACDCTKAEIEVEQLIFEDLVEYVATLKDQGKSATCCDHAWTEIDLNYSDGSSGKITVADFAGKVGATVFNIACASIQSELKAIYANRNIPAGLVITYDDMHPLLGGTTIVISGDGVVERRLRSRKESKARVTQAKMDEHQLLELIQQLITLKAWTQHTANRPPLADEGRATLTINVNGQKSESWEWFNEISKNNRLIRVKKKMSALK